MKKIMIKNKDGGYAILFTVVVVGIISAITIGLTNAAYKQMMLSSVAKDSTSAFYQADIATECAMYADNIDLLSNVDSVSVPFKCGGSLMDYNHVVGTSLYQLTPHNESSITGRCFLSDVIKTEVGDIVKTTVEAYGYNICNKDNFRTVERKIEVNY